MTSGRCPDELLGQVLEAMPNAMILIRENGQIATMNAQAELTFGYKRNEILGWRIERIVADRSGGAVLQVKSPFVSVPGSGRAVPGRDLHALHKGGHAFPVTSNATPIETTTGRMFILGFVIIPAKEREDARIRVTPREEVLLGEIHHRVKNNLQIVSSLLDLQAARIADPAMRNMLRDSKNRIHSMALIHQTLYGSKDFERVDFGQFSANLLPALMESYSLDASRIAIQVDVEPVHLPIDTAVPCGLVVNELVTNALKHAFPGPRRGEIHIALTRQAGNEVLLSVSDDGVGLPDHADIHGTETIGLQLVGLLADQLGGEVFIHRSDPTRISLRFQSDERPEAP